MHKIIVSDTSCLILLEKINRLNLLHKLFGEITITQIVADEFGKALPDFIKVENPENFNYQKILESFVHTGEASSLALALEKNDSLLIVDDNKARREAKQLKLKFTGTLGILILAKKKGFINSFAKVLREIENTDFRISESLLEKAKQKAKE